jgi:hypothetical protein
VDGAWTFSLHVPEQNRRTTLSQDHETELVRTSELVKRGQGALWLMSCQFTYHWHYGLNPDEVLRRIKTCSSSSDCMCFGGTPRSCCIRICCAFGSLGYLEIHIVKGPLLCQLRNLLPWLRHINSEVTALSSSRKDIRCHWNHGW